MLCVVQSLIFEKNPPGTFLPVDFPMFIFHFYPL